MHARALVLGATGMIGAHAVRACLRHNTPVRALIRRQSDQRNLTGLDIETTTGDLQDRASLVRAMKGCDLVIHAAGAYPKRHFGKRRFLARSRQEMANVIDAVRSVPPGTRIRFLYVSSVTTIGRAETGPRAGDPNTEDPTPLAREADASPPVVDSSPYYTVKSLMEEMAARAAATGLDAVIVNPTFCVDEFDSRKTTAQLLIPLAKRRIPAYVPGHLNAVATRDVGEGILLAARRGRAGQRYILGGENTTSGEFLERCSRVVGVRPPRFALPIAAAEAASLLTETIAYLARTRPLFPMAGVQMLKHSQAYDIRLAREELGYVPSSLDDAIQRAYAWYRDQSFL